eukprot:1157713-Pelagomonas_calceolata.AAC.3
MPVIAWRLAASNVASTCTGSSCVSYKSFLFSLPHLILALFVLFANVLCLPSPSHEYALAGPISVFQDELERRVSHIKELKKEVGYDHGKWDCFRHQHAFAREVMHAGGNGTASGTLVRVRACMQCFSSVINLLRAHLPACLERSSKEGILIACCTCSFECSVLSQMACHGIV